MQCGIDNHNRSWINPISGYTICNVRIEIFFEIVSIELRAGFPDSSIKGRRAIDYPPFE
jgi:hypothetical protein